MDHQDNTEIARLHTFVGYVAREDDEVELRDLVVDGTVPECCQSTPYDPGNKSRTASVQPGTTSSPSSVASIPRMRTSRPGLCTATVRRRGLTTKTSRVPCSSHSATFSSTSVYRSPGEITSTARSG